MTDRDMQDMLKTLSDLTMVEILEACDARPGFNRLFPIVLSMPSAAQIPALCALLGSVFALFNVEHPEVNPSLHWEIIKGLCDKAGAETLQVREAFLDALKQGQSPQDSLDLAQMPTKGAH